MPDNNRGRYPHVADRDDHTLARQQQMHADNFEEDNANPDSTRLWLARV